MPPDLTRAHRARVLDYWLGGQHNFSVDREAAQRAGVAFTLMQDVHREQRKFLKRAIAYLIWNQDIHHFVGFGSALPTCGNIHEIALEYDPRATVVYSDIDREVVEYGQEILQAEGQRNVRYEWADAAHPEGLLEAAPVQELLGGERRVGFVFPSLSPLLLDDELSWTARRLYDWAAQGSHLILSFLNERWLEDEKLARMKFAVDRPYFRAAARTLELIEPWRVTEHGVAHINWPEEEAPPGPIGVGENVLLALK